jgi:hypothetical protein
MGPKAKIPLPLRQRDWRITWYGSCPHPFLAKVYERASREAVFWLKPVPSIRTAWRPYTVFGLHSCGTAPDSHRTCPDTHNASAYLLWAHYTPDLSYCKRGCLEGFGHRTKKRSGNKRLHQSQMPAFASSHKAYGRKLSVVEGRIVIIDADVSRGNLMGLPHLDRVPHWVRRGNPSWLPCPRGCLAVVVALAAASTRSKIPRYLRGAAPTSMPKITSEYALVPDEVLTSRQSVV